MNRYCHEEIIQVEQPKLILVLSLLKQEKMITVMVKFFGAILDQ
jgi:hypothetical protein